MKILIDGQTLETDEINRGIGKYFKSVINNMLKMDFVNEWYISASDKKVLGALEPWVAEKLNVIIDKRYSPSNFNSQGYSANKAYTAALVETIDHYHIDTYWNPNPVMINVLFPIDKLNCNMFVTFYDLIPYIFKKQYLDEWPKEIVQEYKRRLNYINSKDCNVLFISEATKMDFDKYVGSEYGSSKVTFLGVEPREFYKSYLPYKADKEYSIVFVGGFDFRKNLYKAVEAFAKAKEKYKESIMAQTKLYLVCKCGEDQKVQFNEFLREHNAEQDVVLTGFVSDEELSHIYNTCDAFFFPSLYEGFGLPILEALLAGCCVLAGNNSSLHEVGKEYVEYCDVSDINEMSEKLYNTLIKSLEEPLFKKQERKEYALQFTWSNTAENTYEYICGRNKKDESYNKRIKVAMVTPWFPQKTGIAIFVSKILSGLEKYMDIDLYVDDSEIKITGYEPYPSGNMYSITQLIQNKDMYHKIIYQLGNNSEYHTKIYEMALKLPGIVEIHDYIMHPFMYYSFYLTNKLDTYKEALSYYGSKGLEHYEAVVAKLTDPDIYEYPMSEYVCSKSQGTIVHSRWVANQMKSIHNVFVVPLPAYEKVIDENTLDRNEFCKKYGVRENEYVIGCMGFVNKNKRPEVVMEAVSKLKIAGYPIKLIFFGNAGDYKKELLSLAKEMKISDNIVITGFLDEKDYIEGLSFSDIIVNLRYPSMGESSGPLCEAFKYRKPVIVSNINQYKEYPDEVCWKVDVGENEVGQLVCYIEKLLKEPNIRNTLASNAYTYSNSILSINRIAKMYFDSLIK